MSLLFNIVISLYLVITICGCVSDDKGKNLNLYKPYKNTFPSSLNKISSTSYADQQIDKELLPKQTQELKTDEIRNIDNQKFTKTASVANENRQNIIKGYNGDSISALINKLEVIKDASKDEFTKSSELKSELLFLQQKPYRFIFPAETDESFILARGAKYNADTETLEINLGVKNETFYIVSPLQELTYPSIILARKKRDRDYIGQNSFGAIAEVYSRSITELGLALININLENKFEYKNSIFSLIVPVKPNLARKLKKDIAFYIDVKLITSNLNDDIILTTSSTSEATIDDPTRLHVSGKYLIANLIEVGVYRKSTGEVLGWKKF